MQDQPETTSTVTTRLNVNDGHSDRGGRLEPDREEFERHFEGYPEPAEWRELFLALASLLAWFLLFAGGTLIGTSTYIEAIKTSKSTKEFMGLTTVVVLFWTITNIGALSILAAILGAFGQRTRFASTHLTADVHIHARKVRGGARAAYAYYASAVMRGFGVYVLVLSGLLVLATESLVKPDQGQYVRLAGMISVVSFYAGYDPEMLAGLLERIKRFLTKA